MAASRRRGDQSWGLASVTGNPQEEAARSEALTTAFLMLAESLAPPQRAVVVLRALGYEHGEIATILDITPAASRQHHLRGMRRLSLANGRDAERDPSILPVASDREAGERAGRQAAQLLDAFLSAARDGEVEVLTQLLHDEVEAYNDGGGTARAARRVLVGVSSVARFVVGVAELHESRRAVRFAVVSGTPGAIVTLSGVEHVLSIQVRDGRIYRLLDVCNPEKHTTLAA